MSSTNKSLYVESRDSVETLIAWVRQHVPEDAKLCIPVSGGMDSMTCLGLAVHAVGGRRIVALHVGSSSLQPEETENAYGVSEHLGVDLVRTDLTKAGRLFSNVVKDILQGTDIEAVTKLEATRNATLIYMAVREIARLNKAMLVGTLDLSEILTGFFPKETYGGDFLPIGGLLRTEIRSLAMEMGLPDLPEAYAVVPGCGSISNYVNEMLGKDCYSEKVIDVELEQLIRGGKNTLVPIAELCRAMSHKSRITLAGRDVFFGDSVRRDTVMGLINAEKRTG